MEFLIITGLSGAGKSRAADVLEDLEYYCVDNMPVALMPRFAELCLDAHGRYDKVALVTDVRERDGFGELLNTLEELKAMDCTVRILYMDADLRTLVRRYKESRRPHPLAGPGVTLEKAVAKEEELLAPIKAKADFVVNSSQLTLGQLQSRMFGLFAGALIEQAGLKGYTVGGAQVSEKHAGFVVNIGGATSHDVYDLLKHVRNTVYQQSGVELEPEVIILAPDYKLEDKGPKIHKNRITVNVPEEAKDS